MRYDHETISEIRSTFGRSVPLRLCSPLADDYRCVGHDSHPNGLPYAAGQVQILLLVPTGGGVTPYVTATAGPIITPQVVALDGNGSFTAGVIANASITPANTHYSFRFCAPALQPPLSAPTQSCFSITAVTVSGSTQNISATANAASVALVQHWNPKRIYATPHAAGTGSISAVTMVAAPAIPAAGTTYTLSGYVTQTVLGSSCGNTSTVVLNAIFQDPNAASAQTTAIGTFTVTTNGTLGIVPLTANAYAGRITFVAAPGTNVQYSTTVTDDGGCSPGPTVQLFPVLEMN